MFVRWLLSIGVFVLAVLACHAQSPGTEAPQPTSTAGANPNVVRQPVPIFEAEAEFPRAAIRGGKPGNCLVSTTVDVSGHTRDSLIVSCTDSAFASNSLDAISKYTFKPAEDKNGKPVAVTVQVLISFAISGPMGPASYELPGRLQIGFKSPPDVTSIAPDANGIYPYAKGMELPKVAQFKDVGFEAVTSESIRGMGCDIILTIDSHGKSSAPQVTSCDSDKLQHSAVASLLKSKFEPALLDGKPVSVRIWVRLSSTGLSLKP